MHHFSTSNCRLLALLFLFLAVAPHLIFANPIVSPTSTTNTTTEATTTTKAITTKATTTKVTTTKPTTPATPTPTCTAPVENSPWYLSELHLFYPATDPNGIALGNGTFSFKFHDNNTHHLMLTTRCEGNATANGDCSEGEGGYVFCNNPKVQFQLQDGKNLMVARSYVNPCEDYPYNGHIAFGQNYTNFVNHTIGANTGKLQTQKHLRVEISELT